MWDSIIQWLRQTSFDTQGLKLSSITAQSFRGIFEHLILSVDEDYYFTPAEDIRERGLKPDAKEKSKWELEFTGALTWFGYPFINSIDVKWLATPSAPYSWPSLLAALHWLSDLGKVKNTV
jgi:kinetochore protein NDC80